ncbi:MAG TPA: glycerate kinase [Chthoniobacterales bacterium]|nr:glycerate kinase [Chthoniobacterales bacterium]
MRVLIAPDKFKGSLSAREVADNIAAGLRDVLPAATIEVAPVADGGEGTADVICQACAGDWVECDSHDALGSAIAARYVWLRDQSTAVMEMSEAAGMWRIAPHERDPMRANTYGVGEMLLDAAQRGAREITVGLGGSATNDGGFGMARALGFRFLAEERELTNGPAELVNLTRIVRDVKAAVPFPQIIAAVDVKSPLLGARGATRTFGPQKGVAPDELDLLESALSRLAEVIARDLDCDFRDAAGAGAAGGLGFGLMSFCGASVRPGFEVVAEAVGLKAAIERSDVVITGEGRLDAQTLEGKVPAGVARLAHESGKRVFAIVGATSESAAVRSLFEGLYVLAREPVTMQGAMMRAGELLQERARELGRAL